MAPDSLPRTELLRGFSFSSSASCPNPPIGRIFGIHCRKQASAGSWAECTGALLFSILANDLTSEYRAKRAEDQLGIRLASLTRVFPG